MIIKKIIFVCLFMAPMILFAQGTTGSVTPAPAAAKKNTISLDVKNMDIVDVLKLLTDQGGFNLSISEGAKGRVTLFLKDVNVEDALEIALVSANLAYDKTGNVINVMSDHEYEVKYGKKYTDKREAQVFPLKYAKALAVREALAQMISSVGKVVVDAPTNTLVVIDTPQNIIAAQKVIETLDRPLQSETFELDYLAVKDLEPKLKDILSVGVSQVNFDEASNRLVVTDYPEKIKTLENIIKAMDQKPRQVLIDAKIVEITPSHEFDSGVNWEYWISKYFDVKGGFAMPTPSSGVADMVSLGTVRTGTPASVGQYTGIMNFLETFGETKILSSPRILALNNKEAKILVGTKEVYITSATSQNTTGAVTSDTVNFVDVGVKLYVTPTINKEGYITLKIKPEISSSETENITSQNQVSQIPVVTTSEAETTVIVKDGVSIIMGGLRKITHTKTRNQVPVLGSIPGLGLLFQSRKDLYQKDELVIVLTPHIISGDQSIEQELKGKFDSHELGEAKAVKEFYR